VTFGIGSAATNLFTNFYSQAAFSAAAYGTFQGGMTAISGGKFWSGFAAGALSSVASSVWSGGSSMDGYGKNAHAIAGTGMRGIGAGTGNLGMIAFGTVSGGAGAAMTGGNFWQGAVTGFVVSGLNHFVHKIAVKKDLLSRFHKINPHEEAPKNVNSLKALLDDVEGLKAFHEASGKYDLKYGGKSNEYRGYTVDETKTHIFYDDAYSSYYKLASTMFHEFYHAFQYNYMNGMIYNVLGNNGYKTGYMNVAGMAIPLNGEKVLEWNAYNFEYNFLGNTSSYVREGLDLYKYK